MVSIGKTGETTAQTQ